MPAGRVLVVNYDTDDLLGTAAGDQQTLRVATCVVVDEIDLDA